MLWERRERARAAMPVQVGLVLNRLIPAACHTPDLFDQGAEEARGRLHRAVDMLNQTYGNGSLFYGAAFGATKNAPMRIAFTRTPAPEVEEIYPTRERRVRPKKQCNPAPQSDDCA